MFKVAPESGLYSWVGMMYIKAEVEEGHNSSKKKYSYTFQGQSKI